LKKRVKTLGKSGGLVVEDTQKHGGKMWRKGWEIWGRVVQE